MTNTYETHGITGRTPLSGSARPRPEHHVFLERADPGAKIAVSLIVRRQPGAEALPGLEHYDQTPLARRRPLTPVEYAERHGAAPADLHKVEAFAKAQGLTVVDSHAGRRTVMAEGTAAQMKAAFGIVLNRYEAPMPGAASRARGVGGDREGDGYRESKTGKKAPDAPVERKQVYHGFDGAVHLPDDLTGVVVAVIGLDDRLLGVPGGTGDPSGATSLSVPTAAGLYNFPPIGAADQTIGIIAPQTSAGVGASYLTGDITAYFASLPAGFRTAPTMNNVNLTVGGTTFSNNTAAVSAVTAANLGSAANGSILEITQDICTSSTIAQGATVNVYFTQNSEAGWVAFLSRVLQPEGENQPTIVSCSWILFTGDDSGTVGALSDSSSSVSVLTTLFQELAAVGVSCFIALGDWGADNWWLLGASPPTAPDGKSHVMYPGTDPWITSCGGTVMAANAAPPPKIKEAVWSDAYSASSFGLANSNFGATGGGVSQTFAAPPYQTAAGVTGAADSAGTFLAGRGVPDVAAMVAFSGFQANGIGYSFTGTSCVAPFVAGLMAVIRSALGVALAPLNSLLYQLAGSAFNDVTTGNNDSGDTPANVKKAIPSYTGTTVDAPFFTAGAGWDACTGLGSIDGIKLLDGIASLLYGQTWYFQVQKGTFGFDEVGITPTYEGKLSLVLEGFTPDQVTAAGVTPKVNVVLPGIDVTVGAAKPQIPSQTSTPQRIFFPCTIKFQPSAIKRVADGGLFPAVGGADTEAPVSSVITFAGQIMTAETVFYLEPGADPYFSNYDPAGTNAFYLSDALRVFTVTPGFNNAPVDGIALNSANNTDFDTAAGYGYIQALLLRLNSSYSDPAGTDPFITRLPNQNAALSADSSVSPTTPNPAGGTPFVNYNFAIARVRLDGAVGESSVKNVKVFFRMFASETGDTDYQPALTYPSTSDAAGLPAAPLMGVGNVTIPFFATGNYEANDDFGKNIDYSGNSINNQPVAIASGKGVWAYYGCYINVYPTGNTIAGAAVQTLFPSTHACLVAQIAFDDSPIPTGKGLSPENFDKLAQRNVVVTLSDNPGPASTHRIPQTFDSRPSAMLGTGGGIADYPDELMIDWGDTPVGSTAHIYWPQVKSAYVLSLAKAFYSTHQLSERDEYTVQCTVQHGYTFVPIPPGTGENFAGLFTVDLPVGAVHKGQEFTITVRRLSTHEGVVREPLPPPPPPLPPPHIAGGAGPAAGQVRAQDTIGKRPGKHTVDWRYVVGTFAVRIPVTTSKIMLPLEENTFAILKWRYERLAHTNRWRPVLKRYLEYIAARIEGLGGQPWTIPPSPWGYHPGHHGDGGHHGQGGHPGHGHGGHLPGHLRPGEREHTGKVDGLVYDRFGDFEGFLLLTEEGHQRSYRNREAEIEALVRFAWQDRAVITVFSREEDPSRPVSVILRRAPPQPKHWPA